jgi:hypothetical protein
VPDLDPKLQARAGVLSGGAAVTLGVEGQGMVAGDLVNTASRIQAAAEPGVVLVGETTKRASEAAIAYDDAGPHELKGTAEAVELYRALRVTAGRAGALKSVGLEPPLVGRDRELRLIKELFHASADERKAHLVSVIGVGGHGKSCLVWEFFKYMDGVADQIYWHRGRCLAYGEGVTYWALAEMVRMRAGIVDGEEIDSARVKLRAAVAERLPDPGERKWVEPRLAHLLGLEERQVHEREDLFAGWRLFFERMAEVNPVVLVFDDMQWADASLLDFVEYLLEWSRNYPIFIVTLARPDLVERHPQWGAGKRGFTSLSLESLSEAAMEALIAGFVPGLPTARAPARGASAQRSSLDPERPALAGAWPIRLSPGPRPLRRLRDPCPARPEGTTPPGRGVPRGALRGRRARGRRSRRVALPGGLRGGAGRRGCGRNEGEGRGHAPPCRRARRRHRRADDAAGAAALLRREPRAVDRDARAGPGARGGAASAGGDRPGPEQLRSVFDLARPPGDGARALLELAEAQGFVAALDAALELGRLEKVEELLGRIGAMRPGELSAFLDGHRFRFRARLVAAQGRDREVEPAFKAVERLFRGYGLVFWLAVTQAEHGEWLVGEGRAEEAEPLLAEARETFDRLGAKPYLERMAPCACHSLQNPSPRLPEPAASLG